MWKHIKHYILRLFVALVIQHAMRVRHLRFPSVAFLALPYFHITS